MATSGETFAKGNKEFENGKDKGSGYGSDGRGSSISYSASSSEKIAGFLEGRSERDNNSKEINSNKSDYESPSVIDSDTKSIDKVESEVKPEETIDSNNPPEPEKLLSFDKEEDKEEKENKSIFGKAWDKFKEANKATPEETAAITQGTDKPNMIGEIQMPKLNKPKEKYEYKEGDDLGNYKENLKKQVEANKYSVLNEEDYKTVNEAVPFARYEIAMKKPISFDKNVFGFRPEKEKTIDKAADNNNNSSSSSSSNNDTDVTVEKSRLDAVLEYQKWLDNYLNEEIGKAPDGHTIKRSDIQSGFVVQDENGNSQAITAKEYKDYVDKEVAYEKQLDEKKKNNITIDPDDPDFYNSDNFESTLNGLGLEIDPESAKEEINKAFQEGRNPDMRNVKVRAATAPDPANMVRNYCNGILTDATDLLFESNHTLRDRVVELTNQGLTTDQIMKDKIVRNELGMAKNSDVANLLMAALDMGPASAFIGKAGGWVINKFINKITPITNDLSHGLNTVNNMLRGKETISNMGAHIGNKHFTFRNPEQIMSMLNKYNNKVNELAKTTNIATAVATGASTLAPLTQIEVNKKDPQINIDTKTSTYDPNIVLPNTDDLNVNAPPSEVDPSNYIPVEPHNITFSPDVRIPDEWRTALEGEVTPENAKAKSEFFEEMLNKGLVENYIKTNNLSPQEADAVYKELLNGAAQIAGVGLDYMGRSMTAAQYIINHPDQYSYAQRVAAQNVLDLNNPNINKDEVATAYKNMTYIEKTINAARFNSAYKNRKADPNLWTELFNEYTTEQKRDYLENTYYEPNEQRLFGVDVSNWTTNNIDQAKNAYNKAKEELTNNVKEIIDWDRLSKTKAGQVVKKGYDAAKEVVGFLWSSVKDPLGFVDKCIEYGIEAPLEYMGDALEKAGNTTVGKYIKGLVDNKVTRAVKKGADWLGDKIDKGIDYTRAALGNPDVKDQKQYEIAMTTKQARGLTGGALKVTEGVMSGNGPQVARGIAEILVSSDPNIDTNKAKNAADQALSQLGLDVVDGEEMVEPNATEINNTSEENETLKKKKKKSNDIPTEEGITDNAAGFNSGLGADTIKYLYNKYGKNILG